MDELSRLLRAGNPFARETLTSAERQVLDDIVAGKRVPRDSSGAASVRSGSARRAPLLLLGGAFSIVAAITVVLLIVTRPHTAMAATPAPLSIRPTAMTLESLREQVMVGIDDAPSGVSRRGAVSDGWYSQLDASHPAATFIQPQTSEVIWNEDDSGVLRTIAGAPMRPDGSRIEPVPVGAADPGSTVYETVIGPGEFLTYFTGPPPEEPGAMRDYLTAELIARGWPSSSTFTSAEYVDSTLALMQTWTLSDAAQRAVIAVILQSDGLRLLGETTDRAGRDGLLLEVGPTDALMGHLLHLVIDPKTWRILASEDISINGSAEYRIAPGAVMGYTLWR
ncbi:MAG: hypothetical protein J7484_14305 [Microbacterium sp.]|nr:hypothetical protein [Microbacterium sp.]